MPNCENCGTPYEETLENCPNCGKPAVEPPAKAEDVAAPQMGPATGVGTEPNAVASPASGIQLELNPIPAPPPQEGAMPPVAEGGFGAAVPPSYPPPPPFAGAVPPLPPSGAPPMGAATPPPPPPYGGAVPPPPYQGTTPPYQGATPPPSAYSPEVMDDIQRNKGMAVLCYLGILILVPAISGNKSPYVKFHMNQGLLLLIGQLAVGLLSYLLPSILFFIPTIAWVALLVFWIIGLVNAGSGKYQRLPLVGNIQILK